MKTILKRSLLALAVAIVAAGSTATAQVTIDSVADIPAEASGGAQGYYEAATGNVFFSLGDDLLIAGIANVDSELIFANFDNTTPVSYTHLTLPTIYSV